MRFPPEGMPEKCNKHQQLGYYETNGLRPDVWFEPSEVWEIRGAEYALAVLLIRGSRNLQYHPVTRVSRCGESAWLGEGVVRAIP